MVGRRLMSLSLDLLTVVGPLRGEQKELLIEQ